MGNKSTTVENHTATNNGHLSFEEFSRKNDDILDVLDVSRCL